MKSEELTIGFCTVPSPLYLVDRSTLEAIFGSKGFPSPRAIPLTQATPFPCPYSRIIWLLIASLAKRFHIHILGSYMQYANVQMP